MSIQFVCPSCLRSFVGPEKWLHRRVRCKACRTEFTVRSADEFVSLQADPTPPIEKEPPARPAVRPATKPKKSTYSSSGLLFALGVFVVVLFVGFIANEESEEATTSPNTFEWKIPKDLITSSPQYQYGPSNQYGTPSQSGHNDWDRINESGELLLRLLELQAENERAQQSRSRQQPYSSWQQPYQSAGASVVQCSICQGTGQLLVPCYRCGGTGRGTGLTIYCEVCRGNGVCLTDCPYCDAGWRQVGR